MLMVVQNQSALEDFIDCIIDGNYEKAIKVAESNQDTFRNLDNAWKNNLEDIIMSRTTLSALNSSVFSSPEKAADEAVNYLKNDRPDRFYSIYFSTVEIFHVFRSANIQGQAKALEFDIEEMNELIEKLILNRTDGNMQASAAMITGLVVVEDKLRDKGYDFPKKSLERIRRQWIERVEGAQEDIEADAERRFEEAKKHIRQSDLISIDEGGNPNIKSHMIAEGTNADVNLLEELKQARSKLNSAEKEYKSLEEFETLLGQAELEEESGSVKEGIEERLNNKKKLAKELLGDSKEEAKLEEEAEQRLKTIDRLNSEIDEKVKKLKNR
jgi:hypothetical protein